MPWLGPLTAVGIVVLAVLVWLLFRVLRQDQLAAIMTKRKGSSRLVSRASYTGGMEAIPVVLSLGNDDAIYYENPEVSASFELGHIDEVEYDDENATGHSVAAGCRILRLRSHGHAFEFILSDADARQWSGNLPQRRAGEAAAAV